MRTKRGVTDGRGELAIAHFVRKLWYLLALAYRRQASESATKLADEPAAEVKE